jgi:hypothetical protein
MRLGVRLAPAAAVARSRTNRRQWDAMAVRTSRSPRNLIRETSRFDYPDPPNLQRLSPRQEIEARGMAEIQDRFVGAGAIARKRDPIRRRRR